MLREHLEVSFRDGHGLPPCFYLLGLLALVEFLLLTPPFLGTQMWSGAGHLLKVCASLAALLTAYFALRVANREYAPSRFKLLDYWMRERGYPAGVVARGQVYFLLTHVACSVLLILPLLVWAGAISHTPPAALAATLALIPFYALCYGIWGLAALALWEGKLEERERWVRGFLFLVILAAMPVYLPLNPVVYLISVAGVESPFRFGFVGTAWSPDVANIAFHIALGGAGLAVHRWALARGR